LFFNNNRFYNHCHLYNTNFAGHCSQRLNYAYICKFSQKSQGRYYCYPNFTDEETEGYGGGGSSLRAHGQLAAESGFGSKCLAPESIALSTVHPGPVGVNQSSMVRGEVKRYDCPSFLLSLKMSGNKAKAFSLVMMFTLAGLRGEI